MNSLSKTAQIVFLSTIISVQSFAQKETEIFSEFDKNFAFVTSVFRKNSDSYFKTFAEMQLNPQEKKMDGAKDLIKATVLIYQTKIKILEEASFKYLSGELLKDKSKTFDSKYLLRYFDLAYKEQFPGLDFTFYEKVENEVLAKK